MKDNDITLAQKKAKSSMIVWFFAYLFLFPFLFFFFAPFIGFQLTDVSSTNKLLSFIDLSPILSMPLSLLLMWFSYSKSRYKITRLCWIIPLLLFALALGCHLF
jgi:hypothetical protein